jgi:hypothetical protein
MWAVKNETLFFKSKLPFVVSPTAVAQATVEEGVIAAIYSMTQHIHVSYRQEHPDFRDVEI